MQKIEITFVISDSKESFICLMYILLLTKKMSMRIIGKKVFSGAYNLQKRHNFLKIICDIMLYHI